MVKEQLSSRSAGIMHNSAGWTEKLSFIILCEPAKQRNSEAELSLLGMICAVFPVGRDGRSLSANVIAANTGGSFSWISSV